MIQDPFVLTSKEQITQLIDFSIQAGVGTIFIQVYRANEAWFETKLADTQQRKKALEEIKQDPLLLLISQAHQHGIKVHAWLNLLSLANNTQAPILKKYGPAILTSNAKKKKSIQEYKIDGQYFLEPSDKRVQQQLLGIIRDLVSAYPSLDGVQFDYIRYPDVQPSYGYSRENMQAFMKATGRSTVSEKDPLWRQWKRDQVSRLVDQLAARARKANPGIRVSTTGCMSYTRAYEEAFQDWASWVNQGKVDFVTLMNYPTNTADFDKNIIEASQKTNHSAKVNMAVGAYKFLHRNEAFQEAMALCESKVAGDCVLFHYGNFLEDPSLKKTLVRNQTAHTDKPSKQ